MFLGKPKPPGLGVGTNKLYTRGLNVCFPLVQDRLAPMDKWSPIHVLPRIMPSIQDRANSRAFDYKFPQYLCFLLVWSVVWVSSTQFEY